MPPTKSNPSPTDAGSDAPQGARAVGAWLMQFTRTCKTCRLYDAHNPALGRFREQLYHDLRELLDQLDDVALDVASRELSYGGAVVYRAPSREDNLAATVHRDGIRRLTFQKGISAGDLDTFVDLVVHVSSRADVEEDLVTLLWEREISCISVVATPEEGDADGGDDGPSAAAPMPWPGAASATTESGVARTTTAPPDRVGARTGVRRPDG